jgi:hypothetical protein
MILDLIMSHAHKTASHPELAMLTLTCGLDLMLRPAIASTRPLDDRAAIVSLALSLDGTMESKEVDTRTRK